MATVLSRRLLLAGATAWGVSLGLSPAGAATPNLPKLPKHLFGGPFDLTDHNGRAVTDEDFRGRFMLVFFGYTYCPDICPTDLAAMSHALDGLPEATRDRVQPLFVTVDPARDTAEVLKDYVGHFHPALLGLTGTEAQVAHAAKAYRVHRSKVLEEGRPPEDYLVNHTPNTYLMGPDGAFVTLFPHDTKPERMTQILTKYLG